MVSFLKRPGLARHRVVTALLGLVLLAPAAWAQGTAATTPDRLCAQASGATVLEIRVAGEHAARRCDLKALMELPARDLTTVLPAELGIAGSNQWRGVSLRQLVERLGGTPGHTVHLSALNDYTVTIPWSDLLQYDPLLAYHRNGAPMPVRDKGPLMLIYPFEGHSALRAQAYFNRSIWQVNVLSLR